MEHIIRNPNAVSPIFKETVTLRDDMGTFEIFDGLPILHGFMWEHPQNISYAREPGSPSEATDRTVRERVVRFLQTLGMRGEAAVLAYAIPSHTDIIDITESSASHILADHGIQGLRTPTGGAFFTTIPGLPLYAPTRDCPYTVFHGERPGLSPVVGLIHAGRAEADKRLPYTAVMHAIRTYGLHPKSIRLGVTPSLEPAHHDIQAGDYQRLISDPTAWQSYTTRPSAEGPYYVDLRSYVADQYIEAGVSPEHLEVCLTGTYASAGLGRGFSYRRAQHNQGLPYAFGVAVQIPLLQNP